MEREFEIETEDGCTWSISWFRDASAFFVDVWDRAPDDEVGGTADPGPDCTCPFPELGVYDTLDTVELAMGMKIPPEVREELLADARSSPISEEDKRAWGRIWAAEVYRTAEDGWTIFITFAPAWEENPHSPLWDEDNFPLV